MPSCALRYCKSRGYRNDGSLFSFPPEGSEVREKWIRFVQTDRREENWVPSASSRICSKHFRIGDIYSGKTGRRVLKKDSVPFTTEEKETAEATEPVTLINVDISDSEPIFDTPREIALQMQIDRLHKLNSLHSVKLKRLCHRNRYLKHKAFNLEGVINGLKNRLELQIDEDDSLNTTEEVQALFDRLKTMKTEFNPSLRNFAINLYKYSPAAYRYTRKCFGNILPNLSAVRGWCAATLSPSDQDLISD